MSATATVDIRKQLNLNASSELLRYLNILVYSQPGAGKTYLAGTAQDVKELHPVIHLGFEQGLLSIAYREDYDKKEIRTIDQLEAVASLLSEDQKSSKPYYKTLIIDNATELQNLDIEHVMRTTKMLSNNPDKVDVDVPSPREWGKIGKRLRRAIIGFRDLEMNTIWTAWEGQDKDSDGNIIRYYPQLSGHVKNELAGYFDIVGHLRAKSRNDDVSRHLQILGTDKVVAKWRNRNYEVVPNVINDPTMQMIWEFVKQSKVAST
jgi:phage nucleotide-binding protein